MKDLAGDQLEITRLMKIWMKLVRNEISILIDMLP